MIKDSLIDKNDLSATNLKKQLAHHLFWGLGYSVVIDEFEFMDIFGIKRSGYTAEFEIKICKADFDREIAIISMPQPEHAYGKEWPKWYKHASYLRKPIDTKGLGHVVQYLGLGEYPNIPNDFYFYLPDFLCDYALTKLVNLPYGLVKVGKTCRNGHPDTGSFYWVYDVLKKPTKLHNNKANNELYTKLSHALTIRTKLLN